MAQEDKIPFWQGTNFWVAALMFIFSLFGLASDSLPTQIVMSGVGVIGAFFAVRQFARTAKFGGWYQTLAQGNTLNYLAQVLLLIGVPNIDQLVPPLKQMIDAFAQGNWGLVISSLVSIGTIGFYIFIKKTPTAQSA